jgi:hypothetical protein
VFLGYATASGHVGLDREQFVPKEWFADRERCRTVSIPADLEHQTKPQLALAMLERALDGGVLATWVTEDEVYGSDGKLHRALEARGPAAAPDTDQRSVGYVLVVRRNEHVPDGRRTLRSGRPRSRPCGRAFRPRVAPAQLRGGRAEAAAVRLGLGPSTTSAPGGLGAWHATAPPSRAPGGGGPLSYVRAGRDRAGGLVRVAGARWSIDDLYKLAKVQVGLDQYEVRCWPGWYRHITLALTVLTIGARKKGACMPRPRPDHGPRDPAAPRPAPRERGPWSAVRTPAAVATWSRWRRHHQKIAQACHIRRRLKREREL